MDGLMRSLLSRFVVSLCALSFASEGITMAGQASRPQRSSRFDVVSIHINAPNDTRSGTFHYAGEDAFIATHETMTTLIALAYGLDSNQIHDVPSWMDSTFYDIAAKTDGFTSLTYDDLKPMLQDLLQQRFHLVCHPETKYVRGYALKVAKGGIKLVASTQPAGSLYILPDGIEGNGLTLSMLASMLSRPVGAPVIDTTGLKETFDIHLEFASPGVDDSSRPQIFTALQEQLGLMLERQQVPQPALMIDHIDRIPTDN